MGYYKGEFEVSYIITPGQKDKPEEMKILRDDSADLTAHDQFFAFKDNYPYAYITSGFLFTDTPPLAQSTVNDLRQWIAPLPDDPDSRGVKGGFPKGGYRKK